jgi:hypothetical protein
MFHTITNEDPRFSDGLSTNFCENALTYNSLFSFGSETTHPDPDLPLHYRREVIKINGEIRYRVSDLNARNPEEMFFGQIYTMRSGDINAALYAQEQVEHQRLPNELLQAIANRASAEEIKRMIAQEARRHEIISFERYYRLLDVNYLNIFYKVIIYIFRIELLLA